MEGLTLEEVRQIFEGCFTLVLSCYAIGLGIGLIKKVFLAAVEK